MGPFGLKTYTILSKEISFNFLLNDASFIFSLFYDPCDSKTGHTHHPLLYSKPQTWHFKTLNMLYQHNSLSQESEGVQCGHSPPLNVVLLGCSTEARVSMTALHQTLKPWHQLLAETARCSSSWSLSLCMVSHYSVAYSGLLNRAACFQRGENGRCTASLWVRLGIYPTSVLSQSISHVKSQGQPKFKGRGNRLHHLTVGVA